MSKNKSVLRSIISCLVFTFCILSGIFPQIQAQEISKLEKAQWLFQHENYEEALTLFKELRSEHPQSSEIAYYLGLNHKRLQDYLASQPHLEAAVTLSPGIKSALTELIDTLYQCDKVEEAKKRIAQAEAESISPAQTAFFKGLVFLKEGKDPAAALKCFEQAETLDPGLAQTVKYQKALANMQLKNYKDAKNYFREIVVKDPSADLAAYANEYIDTLTRIEKAKKTFRGYLGYALQYDDNVVCEPDDEAQASSVLEHKDWKHAFTTQTEYNYKPTDRFSLKAGYSYYRTKQNYIGFYDTVSHDIPIQPTFTFNHGAIAFPVHYNYVSVNEKKYLGVLGMGNVNNLMLGNAQMLQMQMQYNIKDYAWSPARYDDKKSGREYILAAGWFKFFGKNNSGFFNARYALNYEDACGQNWRYVGNRFTFTGVVPLTKKLTFNSVFDYFRQDFRKQNSVYGRDRRDSVYTFSNLLSYEVIRNTSLELQHTYVCDDSSIVVYKYTKNVFGFGMKYRF